MLQKLTVQNFALIETLNVDFENGLSTITGETGAGKSLILGALGLIIGKRTNTSVIKNTEKKCVVEATFDISEHQLEKVFKDKDLDFENQTFIRREILPSGKSRAFVNDSPVNLSVLQDLGGKLIDIHSQHQTLEVTTNEFQFYILDTLAKNQKELESFRRGLKQLKIAKKELDTLKENQQRYKDEYSYNSHLLHELEEAKIKSEELQELEELQNQLANTEEIQERLAFSFGSIAIENHGAFDRLTEAKNSINKIISYGDSYNELQKRISSVCIELDDIRASIEEEIENLEADPNKLQLVSDRLQLLYTLHKKHGVSSNKELLTIKNTLEEQVSDTENIDNAINNAENKIHDINLKLNIVADKIHAKREKVLPKFTQKIEQILVELGMKNASFSPVLDRINEFNIYGGNEFQLLFSANKGGQYGALKAVASGGELSRIVLAIKMLLSQHIKLPTLIFDEIDTGVSGEVAQKMANLLQEMGIKQQVFSITHLPQIAAKGKIQYKVFKEDINNITHTNLKRLTKEERILEIAEMIGGKQLTDAAKAHAESLLLN